MLPHFNAWRRWTRRTLFICLIFVLFINSALALFDEPKPLTTWEDPPKTDRLKPISWEDKNFGQWCRNFSTNSHVQCPEGSSLHWYYCCGNMNTECCVGVQSWAIVVFGSFIVLGIVIGIVSILAYFDLLWSNKIEPRPKKPKQISKKYKTVISGANV